MRTLSSASAMLAGIFGISSGAALAQPTTPDFSGADKTPDTRATLTYGLRHGCEKLLPRDCTGKAQRLEAIFPKASGNLIVALESFDETARRIPWQDSIDTRLFSASGSLDWSVRNKGVKFTLDKIWHLTKSSDIQLGFYLGEMKGHVSATAQAQASLHRGEVTIPDLSWNGTVIPGRSLSWDEQNISASSRWDKDGSSYFGGFRAAGGWGLPLTRNFQAGLSAYGQAGIERVRYGGGIEFIYSSRPDTDLGRRAGGPCQGGNGGTPLLSKAPVAVGVALCFDRVARDTLENKKIEYAGRLAEKINAHLNRAQDGIDDAVTDIQSRLPHDSPAPRLPALSARHVSDFLGFDPDYKAVRQSIVISGSVRVADNARLSLSHIVPIKDRKGDRPRTNITFSYEF